MASLDEQVALDPSLQQRDETAAALRAALNAATGLGDVDEGIVIFPAGVVAGTKTIQDLVQVINQHGKQNGYAVSARCAGNKDVVYTSYLIECDRFGAPPPPSGASLRHTATKKCGCEFFGRAKLTPEGWQFHCGPEEKNRRHNHQPSLDPTAHRQHL
jgi:hypothetical protein